MARDFLFIEIKRAIVLGNPVAETKLDGSCFQTDSAFDYHKSRIVGGVTSEMILRVRLMVGWVAGWRVGQLI